MPEHDSDQINLKRILNRRQEQAQVYFNQIAGRFDRVYGPGRSWQAFGHLLLRIIPPLVGADLASGEGLLSELLARRAEKHYRCPQDVEWAIDAVSGDVLLLQSRPETVWSRRRPQGGTGIADPITSMVQTMLHPVSGGGHAGHG